MSIYMYICIDIDVSETYRHDTQPTLIFGEPLDIASVCRVNAHGLYVAAFCNKQLRTMLSFSAAEVPEAGFFFGACHSPKCALHSVAGVVDTLY